MPSFLSASCLLASGMGFPACFSLPTPTTWAFKLRFLLSHPVFSSLPVNQLPVCVFLLAFLFLGCYHIAFALWYIVGRILNMCFAHMRPPHTCRVFSDFNSRLFTQFFLLYLPISFRFVLFCLLFFQKAHAVCFLTSILAFSHTFPLSTCLSASGLCFLACFPHPTHNKTRATVHPPLSYHFPRVQVRSSSRCSCPVPAPRIP